MIRVSNVDDFAKMNESDLKRFMAHKTGIHDSDIIRDTIQEFYVKLIETKALDTYDPKLGTFKTYIMNLFCWLLPVLANRNHRTRYTLVSWVKETGRNQGSNDKGVVDVYERTASLGMSPYIDNVVDPRYHASHVSIDEDMHADIDLREFMRYVERTHTEKNAERIRIYLANRTSGCNGADVAKILGVSNNMVKMIKEQVRESYEEWRGKIMKSHKRARKLTWNEVVTEITNVQGQIERYNAGDVSLPRGFIYRDALLRLKYLRSRQAQISKKDKPQRDVDHSEDA